MLKKIMAAALLTSSLAFAPSAALAHRRPYPHTHHHHYHHHHHHHHEAAPTTEAPSK